MGDSIQAPENAIFSIENTDDEITHYVCQYGDKLTEETFDGAFNAPLRVGSGKPGTNGCYVLLGEFQRAIYCLEEDGTLKDFVFDPEDWVWTEGHLAQLNVRADPDTSLGAITIGAEDYIEVFFQGPSGKLQSVSSSRGEPWNLSTNLPEIDLFPGASIYAIAINTVPHVFYAHWDSSIHELVFEAEEWSDATITPTAGGSRKSDIYATAKEDGYTLQFYDDNGTLFFLADEKIVEVGTTTKHGFKKSKDAQNTRFAIQARPKLGWKRYK